MISDEIMEEVAIFRSSKRRKFNRTQHEPAQDAPTALSPASPTKDVVESRDEDVEESKQDGDDAGVSNLIRARKHHRRLVGGVQFSNTKSTHEASNDNDGTSTAMVKAEENPIDITNRFIGSTGQVVDVDQHMFVAPDSSPPTCNGRQFILMT